MKPPKGYYTLTEATKVLSLSNAMVRRYVEKGKIHYLILEGRQHGFYLQRRAEVLSHIEAGLLSFNREAEGTIFPLAAVKKDVDTLANELNAFLNTEEEEVGTKFDLTTATKEDLPEIARMATALFALTGQVTVPAWR